MPHTKIRRAIATGDVNDRVRRHLDGCEACRAFAGSIDAVRAAAPAVAGRPAPDGLAGRVVAHVRAQTKAAPAVIPLSKGLGRVVDGLRSRWIPVTAAAALAALAAGVLLAGPRDDLSDALLVAAQRTEAAQSARLELEGRGRTTVDLPEIRMPSFAPDGIPFFPQPDYSQVPDEFRDQVREQFERSRRQLEEGLAQLAEPRAPVPPDEIGFTFEITGKGEIALPDRLRIEGTVTPRSELGSPVPAPYEIIVIGEDAWMRQPDGTWLKVPGPTGPFGPVVLDASAISTFLRHPSGGVRDLGTETLDGEQVRHYRFEVSASDVLPSPDRGAYTWTADVWVGADDDIVRRFGVRSAGRSEGAAVESEFVTGAVSAEWSMEMTVRLFDFGIGVDIQPPPASEVRGEADFPQGSSALLYPFGGHVSVSFGSSARRSLESHRTEEPGPAPDGGFGFPSGYPGQAGAPPPEWYQWPPAGEPETEQPPTPDPTGQTS